MVKTTSAVRERHMPGPAGMNVTVDITPSRLELRTCRLAG
jgi:hypothetical protein